MSVNHNASHIENYQLQRTNNSFTNTNVIIQDITLEEHESQITIKQANKNWEVMAMDTVSYKELDLYTTK